MEISAHLQIQRKRSFVGAAIGFQIFIDDVRVGYVRNNGLAVFEISPGQHHILLKYWAARSQPVYFEAIAGETIKFFATLE
jgi:hypothetical protein